MWTSPEVLMELLWNTAADIWSFGAMVRRIFTAPLHTWKTNAFVAYKSHLRWALQLVPTQGSYTRQ